MTRFDGKIVLWKRQASVDSSELNRIKT